jgi:hypothetical protein
VEIRGHTQNAQWANAEGTEEDVEECPRHSMSWKFRVFPGRIVNSYIIINDKLYDNLQYDYRPTVRLNWIKIFWL